MHMTFISGWAGLPCCYPALARQHNYLSPFFADSLDAVHSALQEDDDLLVGWSTGAHLILKDMELACRHFRTIILVAPFLDFTTSVAPRIVQRMKKRLQREPEATLEEFWALCGLRAFCPQLTYDAIDQLGEGLDFLTHSQVQPQQPTQECRIILVGCQQDQVVTPQAFSAVAQALPAATTVTVDHPHYIPETALLELIDDVSRSAIL